MRKLDKFNKMIAMGAFCVGAAATLVGCGDNNNQDTSEIGNYSPGEEEPETIYGPPEMMDSEAGDEDTPSSESSEQAEDITEVTTETTEESVKTTEETTSSEASEEQDSLATESPASGNEVRTVSNSTQSKKTQNKKSTSKKKNKKKPNKKTTEKKKDKKTEEKTTEEKTTEATTTQVEVEEEKPREYDPKNEAANILYGPPPSDNIIKVEPKTETPTEETTETPNISDYDPKEDVKALTDLYGPPPTR